MRRFIDVWNTFVVPNMNCDAEPALAILRGRDGYRTALPLADLLAPDVLIADRLNDQSLTVEHGAPIRRGQFLPGWLLRLAFRPFVRPIIRKLK